MWDGTSERLASAFRKHTTVRSLFLWNLPHTSEENIDVSDCFMNVSTAILLL